MAGKLDTDTYILTPHHVNVLQTEKSDNKRLRVSSDDLEQASTIWTGLQPYLAQVQVIFVEVPGGTQSASGMKGYGICIGLLAAMRASGKPFFELTPTEVKVVATGDKNASKQQMINWATQKYPNLNWPTEVRKGAVKIIASKAEHMADAVAAAEAGIMSNQFKQFAAMKLL